MRKSVVDVMVVGLLTIGPLSALAHHSFAAEFDVKRPIKLTGVVKEMRFSNPHSMIYVTVTTAGGERQEWRIEGAAPNALLRRGFSRKSLPPGTVITVKGFQARDRSLHAAGEQITLQDGRSLFVGSSGIGAPNAGGEASSE